MSIEPAVAALCGHIFLGERLELTEWIVIVLIASASAGAALTARVEARKGNHLTSGQPAAVSFPLSREKKKRSQQSRDR